MAEIKEILQKNNFRFNKALGQNFITDSNLLRAIVKDSGVTKDDTVVEIGAGAGTLTAALCESAKKVFAFEVDGNLKPILNETLAGVENCEVVFKDVLRMKDEELAAKVGENPCRRVNIKEAIWKTPKRQRSAKSRKTQPPRRLKPGRKFCRFIQAAQTRTQIRL